MIPPDRMAAAHKAFMDVIYGGLLPTAQWSGGPLCQEAPADASRGTWCASQQVPLTAHQPAAAPQPGPFTMYSGPQYGGEPSPYLVAPPDAQPQFAYKDLAPCTDHSMRAPQHLLPAMTGPHSAGTPAHYVAGLGQHAVLQQASKLLQLPVPGNSQHAHWPPGVRPTGVTPRSGQTALQRTLFCTSQCHLTAALCWVCADRCATFHFTSKTV